MAKGGAYERVICKELSLWLSSGKAEDWFWRSAASGGRSTVRARIGKSTAGHDGDICATCPAGAVFTSLVTVEVKCGYNKVTLADVFDRPTTLKQQGLEAFFEQTLAAQKRSKAPHWMLIHRRDRREPVVYFGENLFYAWRKRHNTSSPDGLCLDPPLPFFRCQVHIRLKDRDGDRPAYRELNFVAMTWENFRASFDPSIIKWLSRR